MMVEWEGKQVTLPQLSPHLRDHDPRVREKAFRLSSAPFMEREAELSDLFTRMFHLRYQVAQNAGFRDFRDYSFTSKFRFDYAPEDVERFHRSVETVVTPAVERIRERRRERLRLDTLRPWDSLVETVRPPGPGALRGDQ